MSKFKEGDKVVRITDSYFNMRAGDKGTVVKINSCGVELKEFFGTHDPQKLELVEQENKMKFDLKTQPWFIRISRENYDSINAWLVENFGKPCHHLNDSSLPYYAFVTNSVGDGATNFHSMVYVSNTADQRAKEIKLNFKTVVDSVEWPEVETEAQKELAKLQKQIEELSAQAEKLKETIK